ncbi:NIPSNAP family protein [Roseateles asaccharophilus]|uniref:NIPSNAP domain-containing protein n=1 Tax=Roseateles asaccharophilus TaxID=582607 RepID=A0ABU2AB25_9BURK|nr:NIPSNAP family protein [Roseateles asaccharophilus]MDR7333793.1 hypothetical protein [Roseateles asaccharophilus]
MSSLTLSTACGVVELRQYTLHPGRRDALIDLFDREFVETQEAVGIDLLGQFRDLDDADRFVWLRGFTDMAARGAALPAFYGGPVWAAHRNAANATMVDSDDVLLLRPAWPDAGLPAVAARVAQPAGVLLVRVLHLREAPDAELLTLCREALVVELKQAGALQQAWYASEPAANNFPRLPVREGEQVLVAMALFADAAATWPAEFDSQVQRWLARPTQALRLAPTTRSSLHA